MDKLVIRVERLTGHELFSAEILRQSGHGELGCKETMFTSHVDTDGNKQGAILTAVVLKKTYRYIYIYIYALNGGLIHVFIFENAHNDTYIYKWGNGMQTSKYICQGMSGIYWGKCDRT